MMLYPIRILLVVCTLLFLNVCTAQNVTLDYYVWNPASPPCNIFESSPPVPATVGSSASTIVHQSIIGQPTYNSTIRAIPLQTQYVNASSSLGTKFKNSYNFKQGYRYVKSCLRTLLWSVHLFGEWNFPMRPTIFFIEKNCSIM